MVGAESDAGTGRPRNPALTVDGIVICTPSAEAGDAPSVLLIERGRDPFRGQYALPGGFVDYGEDPDLAVGREVAEETGLAGLAWTQYHTYGRPDRDPRGHTVSVVYSAGVTGDPPAVAGGDDAVRAAWFPLGELPPLAFDHERILTEFLQDRQSR